MQQANQTYSFQNINSESQPDLEINQLQAQNIEKQTSERYVMRGQYMRIASKEQKIDQDAIMKEYYQNQKTQKKNKKDLQKKNRNHKISKLQSKSSNNSDFNSIKNRWKAQIDECVDSYKQFLNQQKKAYDSKHKENLLKLFRVLISGIFQLRDLAQSQHNDLTKNQLKIISPEADISKWITSIVDQFDSCFKDAQCGRKIDSWAIKWNSVVKNCSDLNNLEVRRKIIRKKIKPSDVIQNDDTFLMSEEAKYQEQRRNKLILAQAAKNFQKPFENQSQRQGDQRKDSQIIEVSQMMKQSLSSSNNLPNSQKKASQQKQRLRQEYRHYVGVQIYNNLKNRLVDLLQGSQAYNILINDLQSRFKAQRRILEQGQFEIK